MKTYSIPIKAVFTDEVVLAVEDNTTQDELVKRVTEWFANYYTIFAEEDEEGNYPMHFDTVELNGVPVLEEQNNV